MLSRIVFTMMRKSAGTENQFHLYCYVCVWKKKKEGNQLIFHYDLRVERMAVNY